MSFIHRQQPDLAASDHVEEFGLPESLRGDIQQRILAIRNSGVPLLSFAFTQGRIDKRGRDALRLKCIDLIFHQCNQRRKHQCHRRPLCPFLLCQHQRRNLKAQGFAAACRHDHQRMLTVHDMRNDFSLRISKLVVAKVLLQKLLSGCHENDGSPVVSPERNTVMDSDCAVSSAASRAFKAGPRRFQQTPSLPNT